MNPHHGRAFVRPQEPVMPMILAGRAWTARRIRNNCLRQHCHAVARTFRRKEFAPLKSICVRLLTILETRGCVLHEIHPTEIAMVAAIVRLAAYEGSWLRQPEDWQPDAAADGRSQWKDLLRHLMARYPVPAFLDSAWEIHGSLEHFERDIWCAIGRGRSLREVPGFPRSVSKRVLHEALACGKGASLAEAIWQAQLRLLDASSILQEEVMASRVPGELWCHGLWMRLVAKFATCADVDAANFSVVANALVAVEDHHGMDQVERLMQLPVADLLRHAVKFVRSALQERGHVLSEEQVRQAAKKTQLARIAASRWEPLLGSEFFESRSGRARGHATWRMEELCSVEALRAEGRAMNHCVGGYVRRCRQRSSAIFSLRHRKKDAEGIVHTQSMATIEVHPDTRKVVQIRAYSNRFVNNSLMRIIWEWAEACHLELKR